MKPKQLYFGLLGCIVMSVIAIAAGFVFGQRLLSGRITKVQQLSGDIVLQTEQIQRMQSLENEYQKIAPLATKAQSILPSQKQQAEIVAQINTIVKSNGLPLNGLTFENTKGLPDSRSQTIPSKVSGILIMPVKFESTGTYPQLQGLLKSLEKQQRYTQISALDINRSDDTNKLAFNITLEVYLKP